MATQATRKARSRETEKAVANYLHVIYPDAAAVPSAISGRDILNTPGIAVEVKARRDLNLTAWLTQAAKNRGDDTPVVIHRPDGYGPERIDRWPVTMTFMDFVILLREAGHGGGSDD